MIVQGANYRRAFLASAAVAIVAVVGCGGGSDSVPKVGANSNIDTTVGPKTGRGAPSGGATPPKATPKPADN